MIKSDYIYDLIRLNSINLDVVQFLCAVFLDDGIFTRLLFIDFVIIVD